MPVSGGSCSADGRLRGRATPALPTTSRLATALRSTTLRSTTLRSTTLLATAVLSTALLATMVLGLLGPAPAGAQTGPGAPSTTAPPAPAPTPAPATTAPAPVLKPESAKLVAEQLAVDGVYVAAERTGADRARLVEQVKQARALGLRLVVVVPNDPEPTARAFARRILEASDADAALIFPPKGGAEAEVIPELNASNRDALTAASAKSDPVAATQVFAQRLLNRPSRSLPAAYARTLFLVFALAAVLIASAMIERGFRRGAVTGRMWNRPDWMAKPPPESPPSA